MNPKEKGLHRDSAILQAVESRRALDTDQVRALIFPGMAYGQRKAQERLLKLHRRGRLDRERVGDTFAYYHTRPGPLAHLLGVNWVRLWLEAGLKSWEVMHSFQYEVNFGILRADALAAIKNTVTGRYRFFLIEMDRGTNGFDKVEKYGRLFETGGYAGHWWVDLTERFPPVLVATTAPGRAAAVRKLVKKQNSAGLEFRVVMLDQIKKEVLSHAEACSYRVEGQERKGGLLGIDHQNKNHRGVSCPPGAAYGGGCLWLDPLLHNQRLWARPSFQHD